MATEQDWTDFMGVCEDLGFAADQRVDLLVIMTGEDLNKFKSLKDDASRKAFLKKRLAASTSQQSAVPIGQTVDILRLVRPSSFLAHWRSRGALQEVVGPLWMQPLVTDKYGNAFEEYWERNGAVFKEAARSKQVVRCDSEATAAQRDPCYNAEGELVEAVAWKVVELGINCALHPVKIINRKATLVDDSTESAVDVLCCMAPQGVEVDPRNPYLYAATAREIKRYASEAGNRDKNLDDGVAQVLDRATLTRRAIAGSSALLFGGAASNGLFMRSVVVSACQENSRAVHSSTLRLAQPSDDDDAPLPQGTASAPAVSVDVDSQAFKETVFHVWLSVAERLDPTMRAGAGWAEEPLQRDDEFTVTKAGDTANVDQHNPRITITHQGYGSILTGTMEGCGSHSKEVLVKLGPAPSKQALALHLGLPWERWYQVEREMVVRNSLKQPVRNLAPLLAAGMTSEVLARGGDIAAWSDRTALVLAATGRPLLPPGVERMPTLSLLEVVALLRCLLAVVLDLIAQHTWHNDIRPANVGVVPSAEPHERYYVYDLGAASNVEVCKLASRLQPGKSWQRLSYTSPISDPLFSSLEALQDLPLSPSSDFQSVVYTALVLSGTQLPWATAALANDKDAVLHVRQELASQPALLPGVSAWPAALREVAYAAVRGDEHVVQAARDALASLDVAAP